MAVILGDIFHGNFPLTQGFGVNPQFYPGFKGHMGLDFGCPTGTEIWSATDGVVLRAGDMSVHDPRFAGYGIMVEIWDDKQLYATLYGHLESVKVKPGDRVHARQAIAISDHTGNVRPAGVAGSHLHFGLCRTDAQGTRLDTANGFGGWINALDPAIAKWQITNNPWQPPTPPVDPCADIKTELAAVKTELTAASSKLDHYVAAIRGLQP